MLNAYDLIAIPALKTFARVGSLFNAKLKKGIDGRRDLERTIESHYEGITAPRILIHVASFGELEQAKPIIDALALRIPKPHIHLTFFSPSGYENASGKYPTPDLITYSPFDDGAAVKRFLSIVQPDLALFVRYDVWPNMAKHLRTLQVPSILFSATFDPKRESVVVRKLHRHMYDQLSRIFTISVEDKAGFERLGVSAPIDVAGDTRVDQVSRRAEAIKRGKKHSLPQNIRHVLKDQFVIVAGSTWPEDEALFDPAFLHKLNAYLILAPHEPTETHVERLQLKFGSKAIALSDAERYREERVIIVNSIGKLFDLYQEASLAYVGGGFSAGVHNVLEPAVWGKPVIVGPNHRHSQEVAEMIFEGGAQEIAGKIDLDRAIEKFISHPKSLAIGSASALQFVKNKAGATEKIMRAISDSLYQDRS